MPHGAIVSFEVPDRCSGAAGLDIGMNDIMHLGSFGESGRRMEIADVVPVAIELWTGIATNAEQLNTPTLGESDRTSSRSSPNRSLQALVLYLLCPCFPRDCTSKLNPSKPVSSDRPLPITHCREH